MALLDHFRPPLRARRNWHSFHNAWATFLASAINERLPKGFFAEPNVQFSIEVDVGAFDEGEGYVGDGKRWKPPEPAQSLAVELATDIVEVLVFGGPEGPTLAGAVELVSPANKDRQAHREAFVSKCVSYLNQRVGLIVVDVVTERGGNLHNELLARMASSNGTPLDAELYATAHRPYQQGERQLLDVWQEPLEVGGPLPTLPFWLLNGPGLPVDLGATYERTCRELNITANSR